MYKVSGLIIHLFFYLCVIGAGKPSLEFQGTQSHMDKYSHIKQTHHDNIDDSFHEHTHSHRHSENEEEHEHSHDHSKIAQNDLNFINNSTLIQTSVNVLGSTLVFFEKHLISSAHLLRPIKPPIC